MACRRHCIRNGAKGPATRPRAEDRVTLQAKGTTPGLPDGLHTLGFDPAHRALGPAAPEVWPAAATQVMLKLNGMSLKGTA